MRTLAIICPAGTLPPYSEEWLRATLLQFVEWFARSAGEEGCLLHVRDLHGAAVAQQLGLPYVLHEPCADYWIGPQADAARRHCLQLVQGNTHWKTVSGKVLCETVDLILSECDQAVCLLQAAGPSRIYLNRAVDSGKPIYLIDLERFAAGVVE